MKIRNSLVTIATNNFNSLVDFYQDFLNQSPKVYIPQSYAEFYITGIKLGIFKPKSCLKDEFSHSQKCTLSLCLEVENIEIAIASFLGKNNLNSQEILESSHGQETYIYDPDGNRIILYQPKE